MINKETLLSYVLRLGDNALITGQRMIERVAGEIDWQEFHDVLAGNGPCNQQRMEKRTRAQDDGAWVREAARAYADKHV